MAIELSELGMTQDELRDLVVEKIARSALTEVCYDEEGDECHVSSKMKDQLDTKIRDGIDAAVTTLANKHVLPGIVQQIESLVLQQTNKWGERKGEPVTFIEYLTQRADAYMKEEVDGSGKTKREDTYGSWRASGTRVASMINQHLDYSIKHAMENALKVANNSIVGGLEKAVEVQLAEVARRLQVTVTTKSR